MRSRRQVYKAQGSFFFQKLPKFPGNVRKKSKRRLRRRNSLFRAHRARNLGWGDKLPSDLKKGGTNPLRRERKWTPPRNRVCQSLLLICKMFYQFTCKNA